MSHNGANLILEKNLHDSSNLNYFSKTLPPNTITLRGRAQHMNLVVGGHNIQSTMHNPMACLQEESCLCLRPKSRFSGTPGKWFSRGSSSYDYKKGPI